MLKLLKPRELSLVSWLPSLSSSSSDSSYVGRRLWLRELLLKKLFDAPDWVLLVKRPCPILVFFPDFSLRSAGPLKYCVEVIPTDFLFSNPFGVKSWVDLFRVLLLSLGSTISTTSFWYLAFILSLMAEVKKFIWSTVWTGWILPTDFTLLILVLLL